ncbi:MAG TPA: hypothetical protein VFI73_09480 [Candidatus Nitrosopolaris sp.]|nr:hypothetical protein [Candidatus Nitrosopolaris sp.]
MRNEVKINAEDSSTGVINMIEEQVILCRVSKDFVGATNLQKDYYVFFLSDVLATILQRHGSRR